jgi:RNA polymerase sigma-70 factor (ECF subfamily)
MNQPLQKELEIPHNGDDAFLKSAVFTYTKILYNFIRRFGFSDAETEDILQDIFIKVWKSKDSFHEEKSSLKTWIFTIAKNTIYDALRKKKRITTTLSLNKNENDGGLEDFEDISADIVQLLERQEMRTKLLQAIDSLKETEKIIFLLHVEESLTFHEISLIFNSPLNTIKSNYRRSLTKLKSYLEKET